jgi:hypothetical protein
VTAPATPATRPPGDPVPNRRRAQTAAALIGATLASLAIVAFLILVVVRPDQGLPARTDWHAAAAEAEASSGLEWTILDPELSEGWSANYARVDQVEDVTTWEIGFLTPEDEFIELSQEYGTQYDWTADAIVEAGGREWSTWDRRGQEDVGNSAYVMATSTRDGTVFLRGTASDEEFLVLATAVAAAMDAR